MKYSSLHDWAVVMDARSLTVLALVAISISFRGVQAESEAGVCSVPHTNVTTTADSVSMVLHCSGTALQWTKGSDLCDMEAFTSYDSCTGKSLCTVPSSEYLTEVSTFFCCNSADRPQHCQQIIIHPTVNHSVPNQVRAGKQEAAYTIITAKPRPTIFPGVEVQLENPSASNGTAVMRLETSLHILVLPSQPLTYIVTHTFTVPRDVGEMTFVRFRFHLPNSNWSSTDSLVYADIPALESDTSTPGAPTVEPSSKDPTATPTCLEGRPEPTTAITVGTAIGSTVCAAAMATILSVVISCLVMRKQNRKYTHSTPSSAPAPTGLPLQPAAGTPGTDSTATTPGLTPPSTDSTATTPAGLTPSTESTRLLSGSAGGVAVDHPVTATVNRGYHRQPSGDSPTEGDQLLMGSAGSSGSVTLVANVRPRPEMIGGGGCLGGGCVRPEVGNGDPRNHVYSTVGESLRSDRRLPPPTSLLVARTGLQIDQSFQMYQQDNEISHHSTSSTTQVPSDVLVYPPLPTDQPDYASHGYSMQLHHQYSAQHEQVNVTNV